MASRRDLPRYIRSTPACWLPKCHAFTGIDHRQQRNTPVPKYAAGANQRRQDRDSAQDPTSAGAAIGIGDHEREGDPAVRQPQI